MMEARRWMELDKNDGEDAYIDSDTEPEEQG